MDTKPRTMAILSPHMPVLFSLSVLFFKENVPLLKSEAKFNEPTFTVFVNKTIDKRSPFHFSDHFHAPKSDLSSPISRLLQRPLWVSFFSNLFYFFLFFLNPNFGFSFKQFELWFNDKIFKPFVVGGSCKSWYLIFYFLNL